MITPVGVAAVHAWSLEDIRAARDAQMRGDFLRASQLAASMRTDDAISVALENRLAPQRCIPVTIEPAKDSPAAQKQAAEAEALFGANGVGLNGDTRCDIHRCLVDHEVAFAQCIARPREDGSRVDYEVSYWPIEFVRWDPDQRCFLAQIDAETEENSVNPDNGIMPHFIDPRRGKAKVEIPIVHGDGRWIIFSRHEYEPWKYGALLAAALVWARHAFAIRDWSKGSVSHGNAKVWGTLPEGVALQDSAGQTAEAAAMIELLRAIASSDSPVGIKPFGSEVDFVTNNSSAWQVWKELVLNAEQAAARIYLGTDGTLGSKGGAPGVDIEGLFGVAKTRVESDLRCIERGINTGAIQPWAAINFGDSSLAPRLVYAMPDAEDEENRKTYAANSVAFYADMKSARENGFELTPEYVAKMAERYGVDAPNLKPAPAPAAVQAPAPVPALRKV